jgi:hypothetical protein
MKPKTYTIPKYGIVVEVFPGPHGNGGTIVSKLKEHVSKVRADTIEYFILGHACAGINISSKEYRKGLESSVDAIANHL